jgi:hypothetical protein
MVSPLLYLFTSRLWMGLKSANRSPLGFLIIYKLTYLLLLVSAILLFPLSRSSDIFRSKRQAWTADGYLTFESHFTAWDSEHYLHISERGYEADSGVCAFYPLWPILVRWFSPLVGGNNVLGGMILANLVSLFSFLLFFRFVQEQLGDSIAWLSLVLLLAFPGSLFFHFNYTEGMFLLLLILLCRSLLRGNIGLALLAGFLLPLTRALGVFSVAPILLHVTLHNDKIRNWLSTSAIKSKWALRALLWFPGNEPANDKADGKRVRSRPVATYWVALAPIYGWILYILLMWRWTGNPFEGFAAQKNWGVQSIGNLFDLPKFLVGFLSPTAWHEFNGSVLDRTIFIICVMAFPTIWRLDKTWFLWAVVLAVVPAVSGTFVSFTRFASVAFPVFIAIATVLVRLERQVLRYAAIGVFGILQFVLVWRFLNYSWAG